MRLAFSVFHQRFQLLPTGLPAKSSVGFTVISTDEDETLLRWFIKIIEQAKLNRPLRLEQVAALFRLFRACYQRDGPTLAAQSFTVLLKLVRLNE